MNLADVIRFLETKRRETFDAGVYDRNANLVRRREVEAAEFDAPIEALRELRNHICGEEGD